MQVGFELREGKKGRGKGIDSAVGKGKDGWMDGWMGAGKGMMCMIKKKASMRETARVPLSTLNLSIDQSSWNFTPPASSPFAAPGSSAPSSSSPTNPA